MVKAAGGFRYATPATLGLARVAGGTNRVIFITEGHFLREMPH